MKSTVLALAAVAALLAGAADAHGLGHDFVRRDDHHGGRARRADDLISSRQYHPAVAAGRVHAARAPGPSILPPGTSNPAVVIVQPDIGGVAGLAALGGGYIGADSAGHAVYILSAGQSVSLTKTLPVTPGSSNAFSLRAYFPLGSVPPGSLRIIVTDATPTRLRRSKRAGAVLCDSGNIAASFQAPTCAEQFTAGTFPCYTGEGSQVTVTVEAYGEVRIGDVSGQYLYQGACTSDCDATFSVSAAQSTCSSASSSSSSPSPTSASTTSSESISSTSASSTSISDAAGPSTVPSTCPASSTASGTTCLCGSGFMYTAATNTCDTCNSKGAVNGVGGLCGLACPATATASGTDCICPTGSSYVPVINACSPCNSLNKITGVNGACGLSCPPTSTASGATCLCGGGQAYSGGLCVSTCPTGTIYSAASSSCECPAGQTLVNQVCACSDGSSLVSCACTGCSVLNRAAGTSVQGSCGACLDSSMTSATPGGLCSCPATGQTFSSNACSCPSGQVVVGAACACSDGSTLASGACSGCALLNRAAGTSAAGTCGACLDPRMTAATPGGLCTCSAVGETFTNGLCSCPSGQSIYASVCSACPPDATPVTSGATTTCQCQDHSMFYTPGTANALGSCSPCSVAGSTTVNSLDGNGTTCLKTCPSRATVVTVGGAQTCKCPSTSDFYDAPNNVCSPCVNALPRDGVTCGACIDATMTVVGNTCSCPTGQLVVGSACSCPTTGQSYSNGGCSCPPGQSVAGGACVCSDGSAFVAGSCTGCASLNRASGSAQTGACGLCLDATMTSPTPGGMCSCPVTGQTFSGSTCSCPAGFATTPDLSSCSACSDKSSSYNAGTCTVCPGQLADGDGVTCGGTKCTGNTGPNAAKGACAECAFGFTVSVANTCDPVAMENGSFEQFENGSVVGWRAPGPGSAVSGWFYDKASLGFCQAQDGVRCADSDPSTRLAGRYQQVRVTPQRTYKVTFYYTITGGTVSNPGNVFHVRVLDTADTNIVLGTIDLLPTVNGNLQLGTVTFNSGSLSLVTIGFAQITFESDRYFGLDSFSIVQTA